MGILINLKSGIILLEILTIVWDPGPEKLEMLKYLIEEQGVDVNHKDSKKNAPLTYAVKKSDYDSVK